MTSTIFVIVRTYGNQFKCNYLRNKKIFHDFLHHFWNVLQVLNILKERMTLIADLFLKLGTANDIVRQMPKKPRFRTPFDRQHVKGWQTLLTSARRQIYQVLPSLRRKWSWKMSLLVISEILGLFVNILTADDKYFLRNSENLRQPTQRHLSIKVKPFSDFSLPFVKSKSIFGHFEMSLTISNHRLHIFEITKLRTTKDVVKQMSKKPLSRTLLNS